jgi:hypothetical protein
MDAVANLLDEPDKLLHTLGVLPIRTTILPNIVRWLVIVLSFFLNVLLIFYLLVSWGNILFPEDFQIDFSSLLIFLLPILGLYFLRRYVVNRQVRYLPFLSYWWAVGFAALLAAYSVLFFRWTFIGWLFLPVPLFMLRQEVKMWLPSPTKLSIRLSDGGKSIHEKTR